MMRSLWTAATGMTAQQTNVDTISNNLANVNTTGFKRETLEFKTLLYQTMQRADLDPANQTGRPVNLQVGLGVRPIASSRSFDVGNMQVTSKPMDFALEGDGFFTVRRTNDQVAYSKDGSFYLQFGGDGLTVVTAEGYPVLGTDGESIIIPNDVPLKSLSVNDTGQFFYVDENGEEQDLGFQFNLVQFNNVQGLESVGGNLYVTTVASGEPIPEYEGEVLRRTNLVQGSLEMSNVQVADEMVKLIVAQRAYELNSKVITTSDDMLQQAANLKR